MAEPDPVPSARPRQGPRTDADRLAEHRAINELATRLVPALIARLGASSLAELEVREGDAKVRLRRPLDGAAGRPATDRQFRIAGGSGHGAGTRGGDAARPAHDVQAPARDVVDPELQCSEIRSPAVGIFRPRPGIGGSEVRVGDRLGVVDMLGVAQEVIAPLDGVVAALLAEAGDGVEYGQPLLRLAASVSGGEDAAGERAAVAAGERA